MLLLCRPPVPRRRPQLNWWAGVPQQQFLKVAAQIDGSPLQRKTPNDTEAPPAAAEGEALPDAVDQPPPISRRLGHAGRQGYIILTPNWTRPGSRRYEYSELEHHRVLSSLRDAMRRVAIDSDRVFITGHGAGGTAAWDIAISHPDLWAGFVAISCDPDKTIHHYNDNARHVPAYIIGGDKDNAPLSRYGGILDDYMSYHHDAMVVMYRGRGREFFYEEIDRIFEWMNLPSHRRRPIPRELELDAMRSDDRFFWWLEWEQTLPAAIIDPATWDDHERIRASPVEASIGQNNEIRISQAPAERFIIWLTPEMGLDLYDPVVVRYKGRRFDDDYDGNVETMLEDVRRRGDRRRPFWHWLQIP